MSVWVTQSENRDIYKCRSDGGVNSQGLSYKNAIQSTNNLKPH